MVDKNAGVSYVRLLSPEEALAQRKEGFGKIHKGTLFDLGRKQAFLAVKKIDAKSWEVIELDKDNRDSIVKGNEAKRSILSFDQMDALNVF